MVNPTLNQEGLFPDIPSFDTSVILAGLENYRQTSTEDSLYINAGRSSVVFEVPGFSIRTRVATKLFRGFGLEKEYMKRLLSSIDPTKNTFVVNGQFEMDIGRFSRGFYEDLKYPEDGEASHPVFSEIEALRRGSEHLNFIDKPLGQIYSNSKLCGYLMPFYEGEPVYPHEVLTKQDTELLQQLNIGYDWGAQNAIRHEDGTFHLIDIHIG